MPSGGKGGGTTTTQTVNPTQAAQLPYLQSGWGSAQNLYQNTPYSYYPGTTLATPNAYLPGGYNQLAAAGQAGSDMIPGINSLFSGMTNGVNNIYNSPAFAGLSDIASGANAYLQQSAANIGGLSDIGNQAAANPYAGLLSQTGDRAGSEREFRIFEKLKKGEVEDER